MGWRHRCDDISVPRLYGPLFSTGDIDAHLAILGGVYGMGVDAAAVVGGDDVRVLRTPGVPAGAVIVRRDPVPDLQTRDKTARLARDALRVVDFYAPDLDVAVEHVRGLGLEVEPSQAGYELADGSFREAHLPGPDGTTTALLTGPADFFTGFAQIRDRVTSEVCSISLPVGHAQPSLDFYADVFGWRVVYEYSFDDRSFSEMVGSAEHLRVRSSTVGRARDEPYLNLVDYGTSAGAPSLQGLAGLDRRGLVGVVVLASDLDDIRRRAAAHPDATCGPELAVPLAPYGDLRVSVITSPHEIAHVVVQQR